MRGMRPRPSIPAHARIEQLVLAQARRAPSAVAVETSSGTLTHAALDARSAAVAGALAVAGVRAGDRVGLLLERDLALLPALLGVLRAGHATCRWIRPRLPSVSPS